MGLLPLTDMGYYSKDKYNIIQNMKIENFFIKTKQSTLMCICQKNICWMIFTYGKKYKICTVSKKNKYLVFTHLLSYTQETTDFS